MRFIQLLEKKFGRYAIRNLMKYIILLYGAGLLIYTFSPNAVLYLGLDIDKVLKGQVWRLVTFLIPYVSLGNIFFVFIKAYLFYMIGNALENAWGSFRLNLYFFSAVIFNIIAAFIVYGIFSVNILGGYMILLTSPLEIIYSSMFFAFAALYPNTQFLIYFIIPVKVKYLAWISGAMYIYNIYNFIVNKFYLGIIPIVVSLANFLIFYFATRDYRRVSPREFERRVKFRKQMNEGRRQGNVTEFKGKNVITRHKCAVCGRSELDDDNLEFRFCSKCDGNYEYCMEHLFTHNHVRE
ncbi:MAG: rhomboid family intramembrane serine protease [Clostridiales bacterium]|nr:rhomboid family intramembrane serine protease [Clostridiales bacterium]